ncbi:hypothetical protein V9K67_10905 [Paraflavisolibacter sp. H34]|uniref:hypothetical protein n=1 Tax=Huijunlia imazamoxiresistens TaxID=3127457 RepID=UPI003015F14F
MKTILYILVCLLFTHCFQVEHPENNLSGSYIGYFHRNHSDTAQVTLCFGDGQYHGKSHQQNYPLMGAGSFEQQENYIIFRDSGNWAGPADNSLILNGSYHLQENDDGSIRIWREIPGGIDEYIFARQSPEENATVHAP